MRQIEKTTVLVHRHSFSEATCLSDLFETLAVFLYPGASLGILVAGERCIFTGEQGAKKVSFTACHSGKL